MNATERQQLDLIAVRLETEGLIYPDCKWLISRLQAESEKADELRDTLREEHESLISVLGGRHRADCPTCILLGISAPAPDLSGPDGPIADSDDGYCILPGEEPDRDLPQEE